MLRRGGKIRDSVKHGYGRADADGGWRMADGGRRTADGGRRMGLKKKKEEEEEEIGC